MDGYGEHTDRAFVRLRRPRRMGLAVALLTSIALVGGACGGGDSDDAGGSDDNSNDVDAGTPVSGGELVYGLEAENSGGWCLPESQLAVSGIMVAKAIYDTLTVPDAEAEFVPYLAESIESNDDYTEWTITLRDGVTFHDGTPLDATVVKNNIDAWRGEYPGRNPLLLRFAYSPISDVVVNDDLTLTVSLSTAWPSFKSYLYYAGRVGIMAQAQLDDPDTCDTKLIGTGPFELEEWVVNDHLSTVRNGDYWRTDDDGTQLPYLDSVEFRPFPEGTSRVNALLSGQVNAIHTAGAADAEALLAAQDDGTVTVVQSGDYPEVQYGLLNSSKPPFNNILARRAAAAAFDAEEVQQVINLGMMPRANGPFGPGEVGYLEDTGFPTYDPELAKDLAAQYEEETGEPLEITFTLQNTGDVIATGQMIQEQAAKAGIKINLDPVEQATLISRAIGGDFELLSFRLHAGGDPDNQYIWWYGGGLTNFARFDDPKMNELLDAGRAEPDPEARRAIYEDVNRLFAEQVYDIWLNWQVWTIATQPDVHGITGGVLPDGQEPFSGLADGHDLASAWISD